MNIPIEEFVELKYGKKSKEEEEIGKDIKRNLKPKLIKEEYLKLLNNIGV